MRAVAHISPRYTSYTTLHYIALRNVIHYALPQLNMHTLLRIYLRITQKNDGGKMFTFYKRLYLDRHFLSRGMVSIVGVVCLCVISRLQAGFSQPLPRLAEVAYSVRGSLF